MTFEINAKVLKFYTTTVTNVFLVHRSNNKMMNFKFYVSIDCSSKLSSVSRATYLVSYKQ